MHYIQLRHTETFTHIVFFRSAHGRFKWKKCSCARWKKHNCVHVNNLSYTKGAH